MDHQHHPDGDRRRAPDSVSPPSPQPAEPGRRLGEQRCSRDIGTDVVIKSATVPDRAAIVVTATSGCAARRAGFAQNVREAGRADGRASATAAPAALTARIFDDYARKLRELQAKATTENVTAADDRVAGSGAGRGAVHVAARSRPPRPSAGRRGVSQVPVCTDYAYRHYQRALRARAVRQRSHCRGSPSCGATGACRIWRWAMPTGPFAASRSPRRRTTRSARCFRRSARRRTRGGRSSARSRWTTAPPSP